MTWLQRNGPGRIARVVVLAVLVGACDGEVADPRLRANWIVGLQLSDTALVLAGAGEYRVGARVMGRDGESYAADSIGVRLRWRSSDPAVAEVDDGGLVRAKAPGAATIVASAGGVERQVKIRVAAAPSAVQLVSGGGQEAPVSTTLPEPIRVRLLDKSGDGMSGATLRFTVLSGGGSFSAELVTTDAQGEAAVTWTLGPEAGEQQGRARTARGKPVSVDFSATATGGTDDGTGDDGTGDDGTGDDGTGDDGTGDDGTGDGDPVPATVAVTPDSAELSALGDTVRYSAEVWDGNGDVLSGVTVTWTSLDPSMASVDGSGLVTALGNGTASVVASAGDVADTAKVVVRQAVASVSVTPAADTVEVDQTVQLTAEAEDANGAEITDASFTWTSSDATVAAVDAAGLVTAKKEGSAAITAKSDGVTAAAAFLVVASALPPPSGAFPAFPGAEGYGAEALRTCDRSKLRVIAVTNLNDSGSGSLRDAMAQSVQSSGELRVIIFRVAGTITLQSGLSLNRPCVYIAGQTAPGGGITLRLPENQGHTVLSLPRDASGNNVVVRYLKVRSGRGEPGKGDNVSITGGYNIVFDHMSIQWSNDENIGVNPIGTTDIRDMTIQRSIIAEALRSHSTGMLLKTVDGGLATYRIAIHHNLFAHNGHRNPRFNASSGRVVNNVMYNWKSRNGRTVSEAKVDWVGNTFKAGPWSSALRVLEHESHPKNQPDNTYPDPALYLTGNSAIPLQPNPSDDNWNLYRDRYTGEKLPSRYRRSSPLAEGAVPITVHSASTAYSSVLANVGANARLDCEGRWVTTQDRVDADIVSHVKNGTGPANDDEVDHQDDFGGYPSVDPGTACKDADGDGMPDAYETRWGFNANDAADARKDADGDGYTNLEEYLNGTDPTKRDRS